MSVCNEFDASGVRISSADKTVYALGINGAHYKFSFNVDCLVDLDLLKIRFFFDLKNLKCLFVFGHGPHTRCVVTKFWIADDKPVLAVNYFAIMDRITSSLEPQFKDQYASYIIDETIND